MGAQRAAIERADKEAKQLREETDKAFKEIKSTDQIIYERKLYETNNADDYINQIKEINERHTIEIAERIKKQEEDLKKRIEDLKNVEKNHAIITARVGRKNRNKIIEEANKRKITILNNYKEKK